MAVKQHDPIAMIRSLFAIIIASVLGVALARFIESASYTAAGAPDAFTLARNVGLAASWLAGAFVAAAIALLLGRRWAALGWLGAATMGLSAFIGMAGAHAPPLLWLVSLFAVGAGGWGAVKILRGVNEPPHLSKTKAPFDD